MGKQRKAEVEVEEKESAERVQVRGRQGGKKHRWVDAIDRRNPRGKRDCCLVV